MSSTKLLIHATWPIANYKPLITKEIKKHIYNHIRENSRSRSIQVLDINGPADHIHIIISLHPTQNLSQVIHEIKGESSSWINKIKLTPEPFKWQEDYTAITISPANKRKSREYLGKQEKLHDEITFLQEVKNILSDTIFDKQGTVDPG